ncbi:helix-turn-helix domain-containing protein [Dyadobacter luticola]|uniref:Helix-turn-helix transcriptional regulator n=1 Tax=Dyadobacter luticola TaxID=1979387 RepID=A0A5R9KVN3_9BACT|nr:helix-turn-helix transcriptional regulator [Dyadobacter luticola]TLV00218.1 helix-turn-helix transcriptional regulator [Dyadobacter luticola]
MKKPKITMDIIKEDVGYSAVTTVLDKFIGTEGEDFEELKANILEAVNLGFEEAGFKYTIDEIILRPDLPSFFAFYKVINAKVLGRRIGMSQSLLAQYINGIKKPSAKQTQRILDGVQQVGRELVAIQFLSFK